MLESPSTSEHCEIFIAPVVKNICFKNENGCLLKVLLKPPINNPPTTDSPTHRPTDPPTSRHQLTLKQITLDSKFVLQSLILQNFLYQLVQVIT